MLKLPYITLFFITLCTVHRYIQTFNADFLVHDTNRTSRSFLFPRPLYHSLAATQNFLHNFISCKSGEQQSILQVTGLYQHSLCTPGISGYFLTHCANALIIKGDSASNYQARDVRAEWLNLPADFNGTLYINPAQQQAGALITFNYAIGHWFASDFLKYAWLQLTMPIIAVKNNLHLRQTITQAGSAEPDKPYDIITAFNQSAWCYGKISPTDITKSGVAELRCDVGVTMPTLDPYLLLAYGGLIVPTAPTQKADYLFNTFLGPNKHTGLSMGVRFEAPIFYSTCGLPLYLFFHVENIYYFPNKQWRMLDLKNCSGVTGFAADLPPQSRQWSRYLLLRKPGQLDSMPGINILTQYMHVHPYSTVDLSVGLKINYYNYYVESGYNLWARGREKLRFVHPACETGKLSFEHFGIAGSTPGTSSHTSTIRCLGPDDETFRHITQEDISLASASYPGGAAHRLHLLAGYSLYPDNSCFGALGGFYEFPHDTNTVFKNWGLWAQTGIQF